ncbi:NUDIX domain-containing protein [Dysgonomonas alginatilytica]|uniref:NUDIX domain-containing protein n=1 Tax=Dysgonomonas alginatilytica TaxID=1605892 RepID=A0A2V3PVZ7_9BACT|nr:NUDIX domain-containing protein [Dysgonomonas alginatilytica]PXV69086.1 NUDIX domain-containing protein [Dysgonomonas alginatilytica]
MTTKSSQDYKSPLKERANVFLPSVSIDCTIFGFHDGILKVLLNKFKTNRKWMLPGGFVFLNENINNAAHRILSERTGLNEVYLKQFYLFGDTERVQPDENKQILDATGINQPHWLLDRFVSIGYYALVNHSQLRIYSTESEKVEWFHINEIPKLYGDHNRIIEKAIRSIRSQINSIPIGYELLPEKFTMSDLRIIYETILDRKLDRRNFQRKMLSTGVIIKLDEVSKKWGCKSACLFTFDKEKYNFAQKSGMAYSEW